VCRLYEILKNRTLKSDYLDGKNLAITISRVGGGLSCFRIVGNDEVP